MNLPVEQLALTVLTDDRPYPWGKVCAGAGLTCGEPPPPCAPVDDSTAVELTLTAAAQVPAVRRARHRRSRRTPGRREPSRTACHYPPGLCSPCPWRPAGTGWSRFRAPRPLPRNRARSDRRPPEA